MVDGLDGLGHDAVVGGYHQDRDIRHLGASGAHSGERLMAGRIQEGNFPVADINPVGADMLGNAAGLSRGNIGVPDGVQQRGFTVVNVSHDHYHRRSGHQVLVVILAVVDNPVLNGDHHFFFYLAWNSIATRAAVSKSITSFTVAMVPIIISFLMTSAAVAFKRKASSPT